MSFLAHARSHRFAVASYASRLVPAGIASRRWGWQLVDECAGSVGHVSQHPVGAPV